MFKEQGSIQGDYDNVRDVADAQTEYRKDQEKEQKAQQLLEKIDLLQDGQSLSLSFETDDKEVLELVYNHLGVDGNKVADTFKRLQEDNDRPKDQGKVEYKALGFKQVDIENSTPPEDIDMGNYWKLIRTNKPDCYIRVGFHSPADRSPHLSVERISDVREHLKKYEKEKGYDGHPLAPAVRADRVLEEEQGEAA